MSDTVRKDLDGGITLLKLNRPDERNAFSRQMLQQLIAELALIQDDERVKVVILTGEGEAFCAGGNVKEMGARRPVPLQHKAYLWDVVQRVSLAIESFDKPLIAALNGPAIGAGFDLALACDIRIAAMSSVVASSYIKLALPPGNGAAWYLPRLVGTSKSLELLWTGRRLTATEAHELGLVDRLSEDDRLEEDAIAFCRELAQQPLQLLRVVKRLVRQASTSTLSVSLDMASSHFAYLQETDDHVEAVDAFIHKRPPRFNDR